MGQLRSRFSQGVFTAALLGAAGFVIYEHSKHFDPQEIVSARNFYGVITIRAGLDRHTGKTIGYLMRSGTTGHGGQMFGGNLNTLPTTYYSRDSGVGKAIWEKREASKAIRVGVIGLGTGTLAAYGRAGDRFRFYELNPAVVQLCREHFTYLNDSKAECDVVLGDGRISLEQEPPQAYDVLVLDAFSSDAIPTHLLTAEAFEVYQKHLASDGILAIHISNKHLNLAPVVAAAAAEFGFAGMKVDTPNDHLKFQLAAEWILLTRDPESAVWRKLVEGRGSDIRSIEPVTLWTDDFSNVLSVWK
jgi:hypothetical protein